MAYDPDNIFAKILRGEIPCHKIYEDDDTLVFLDIMPRTEGHALVITKEKARDLFDIKPRGVGQAHGGGAEARAQDQGGGRRRRRADPAIQRRTPPARPCSTCTSTSCRSSKACR